MRRAATLLFAALAACTSGTPDIPLRSRAADAGHVVIAIGKDRGFFESYSLLFRRTDDPSGASRVGSFTVTWRDLDEHAARYVNGDEQGVVLIASLPPGGYEIFNFEVRERRAVRSSRTPISIPFTVQPNEAVYLGNYQANRFGSEYSMHRGVFFVVDDRLSADLALARRVDPSIPSEVRNGTPLVALIGNPLFVPPSEKKRILETDFNPY